MNKKSIAIETVVFILLSIIVLIAGILIVYGLYNMSKSNIHKLNETYGQALENIKK